MKTLKYIIITCIGCMTLFLNSCSKEFLNVSPPDQIASDQVWNDPALAKAFVTGIYQGLGVGGFEEQMLASISDEAVFTHTGRNINTINEGSLSATNVGWESSTYSWSAMYQKIRACNLAIMHLSTPSMNQITDNDVKKQLLGESYFMRGYFYQQLLRFYGGIPLIDKPYNLNDSFNIARNTYANCVSFITNDCDSAANLLSGLNMEKGRASQLAALALKSRVLLYAASDLHESSKLISTFPDITSNNFNIALVAYTSGNQQDRWKAAQDAAKIVLNKTSGYKMGLTSPVSATDGMNNYISIAMGGGSTTSNVDASASNELIFARYFTTSLDEGGSYVGRNNGPNGYHNWSGNTPIQELVDDYEMSDGTKFDWTNSANKAHPYFNRDPRFYATVLYDGAGWKPRNLASGNVDPANQIQTGKYDLVDGSNKITFNGLDTRSSSIEDWNGSRTGYYFRKFIDPNPNIVDATMKQYIPWPFIRYTEVVLNYIESCLELNQPDEAKKWLNQIRFRAGMPAISDNGTTLRDRYRNERRVELAYEEHRYHDARRWLIASSTLGRKIVFMNITGSFLAGKTMTAPYHHDETIYNYVYTPIINNEHENRTWINKMYFRPLSRNELNKNNLLVQNPGY